MSFFIAYEMFYLYVMYTEVVLHHESNRLLDLHDNTKIFTIDQTLL